MKYLDEITPLKLQPKSRKAYIPINFTNKKKNAAIILLSPGDIVSFRMMNLDYIQNRGFYTAYYMDRNVGAYIGTEDIIDDDVIDTINKSDSMTEAVLHRNKSTDFDFIGGNQVDHRMIRNVYNDDTLKSWSKRFKVSSLDEKINVIIHPTLRSFEDYLRGMNIKDYKKYIVFSYTDHNNIHILSPYAYRSDVMDGPYNAYLLNELISYLIIKANPNFSMYMRNLIAIACSGQYEYFSKNKNFVDNISDGTLKFVAVLNKIIEIKDFASINAYIKDGRIRHIRNYLTSALLSNMSGIYESTLSTAERNKLDDSDFGLPEVKKYPMPDESHVRSAIRFFNHVDPKKEKKLAEAIKRKIKEYNMTDISIGPKNRLSKYITEGITIKEDAEVITETRMYKSDYADVLKIVGRLSDAEFKRISFHDTYQNSPFIVHRDILKTDIGEPVGFLDVYQFPSSPNTAQLTVAMDPNYRGNGYMKQLVNNLINSDLASRREINQYIWTVHPDNIASIRVAESNGFINTNKVDKYGRLVYVFNVDTSKSDFINFINSDIKDKIDESGIVYSDNYTCITENGNISGIYFDPSSLDEGAPVQDTKRMKKFLYNERIKNNKEIMAINNRAREYSPWIDKTYTRIDLYKGYNLFIDTSYYHSLFLRNNTVKLDRGVNLYFDFLNKMINNKEYNQYTKKTIYIPLFSSIWGCSSEDLYDYKLSINPISTIMRLMRINPGILKKEWGNKVIIFLGNNGYFRVDFNDFKFSDMSKFRKLCDKLLLNQAISSYDLEDDDIIEPEDSNEETDSKKVIVTNIIDKIEKGIGVTIDNISTGLSDLEPIENEDHLRIRDNRYDIENGDSSVICVLSTDKETSEKIDIDRIIKNSGKSNTVYLIK